MFYLQKEGKLWTFIRSCENSTYRSWLIRSKRRKNHDPSKFQYSSSETLIKKGRSMEETRPARMEACRGLACKFREKRWPCLPLGKANRNVDVTRRWSGLRRDRSVARGLGHSPLPCTVERTGVIARHWTLPLVTLSTTVAPLERVVEQADPWHADPTRRVFRPRSVSALAPGATAFFRSLPEFEETCPSPSSSLLYFFPPFSLSSGRIESNASDNLERRGIGKFKFRNNFYPN